ncbi:hypothetical protein B0H17DRAFT_1123701 [Mycena rosella]|uniref:Uncharacterized protein n=1 Tax=Mycena rosella TaxID=1033263 RepID=A0AAD7MCH2_MYCRO|nr:hypothetical protein B0H17DRAFT_1123701 [Mycena rosella]
MCMRVLSLGWFKPLPSFDCVLTFLWIYGSELDVSTETGDRELVRRSSKRPRGDGVYSACTPGESLEPVFMSWTVPCNATPLISSNLIFAQSSASAGGWEADWQDDDDDDLPSFLKPATLSFVFDPASTGLTSSSTSASLAQSSANGPSRIIRKANPAPRKGLHIPKSSSNIWRRY